MADDRVFLSYNSKDREAVRTIDDWLRAREIPTFRDERDLLPGDRWQEELQGLIRTVSVAVIFVGASGLGRWERPEIRGLLDQATKRGLRLVPVLLPGASQPVEEVFLGEFSWSDLRGGLEETGLTRLEAGIRKGLPPTESTSEAAAAEGRPSTEPKGLEDEWPGTTGPAGSPNPQGPFRGYFFALAILVAVSLVAVFIFQAVRESQGSLPPATFELPGSGSGAQAETSVAGQPGAEPSAGVAPVPSDGSRSTSEAPEDYPAQEPPATKEPVQAKAPTGEPRPSPPTYPQWSLGPAGESATILLSPDVSIRMILVSRNATGKVWPFSPYFISIDPVPALALRMLMDRHRPVLTITPEGAKAGTPLDALWYPDSRVIADMLCATVPTYLEWINAVLAEAIHPGEVIELAFNPRFGGVLSQVSAAEKVAGPYIEMAGRKFGLNAYSEGAARDRGLGPPKGHLRLVAPPGQAFLRCGSVSAPTP